MESHTMAIRMSLFISSRTFVAMVYDHCYFNLIGQITITITSVPGL